jgi:RNA polymerase sigma factor (sigma-70 family)
LPERQSKQPTQAVRAVLWLCDEHQLALLKGWDEAVEILNDAFLKVFNHLDKYDTAYPFKVWLRRIVINAAIDYHRKNKNLTQTLDLASAAELAAEEMPLPKLSKDEDVLRFIKRA